MKILASLAVLLVALFVVATTSAATPRLSVSPNPTHVGDNMVVAGCGYTPGSVVQVQLYFNSKTATVIDQIDETVDANGCLSTSDNPMVALYAGKWVANVFEFDTGHKDATLNFTVT